MQDLMELKQWIVDAVKLQGVAPAGIDDGAPLVNEGLGLDSVDIICLVTALDKDYGVRIESIEEGQRALASVSALAAYIAQHGPGRA